MATLESDESNIFDAETFNWQLVLLPVLGVLVVIAGVIGYFYHQQTVRTDLETNARAALVDAKTPEDMVKVADQFPGADQATLALLSAADASFAKRDFPTAITTYQRVIASSTADAELRDSAQLGLASAQEANGKDDDAIATYLLVAREGAGSAYSNYAYDSVAMLYDRKGDKANEQKILTEAAGLDPDSFFVKKAQEKLKELTVPPITVPVSMPAPATTPAATPAAPAATPAPAPAAK
jgi:predicted negative regulator of RcsB-dependent stress response